MLSITAGKQSVVKSQIGSSFWIEPLCVTQPSVLIHILCVADRAAVSVIGGVTGANGGKALAERKIGLNA